MNCLRKVKLVRKSLAPDLSVYKSAKPATKLRHNPNEIISLRIPVKQIVDQLEPARVKTPQTGSRDGSNKSDKKSVKTSMMKIHDPYIESQATQSQEVDQLTPMYNIPRKVRPSKSPGARLKMKE